jgi:hypothetical protein
MAGRTADPPRGLARGIRAARTAVAALLLAAACGDADGPAAPRDGVPYGPGPHWIDAVGAGTVRFAAEAGVAVDVTGDGNADATLALRGDTVVHRSAAYAIDATRPGHRNHLDLEIVAMRLRAPGVELRAGDGVPNLVTDGPLFSIGTSDERDDDPARATDRFAVAFTVEIGGRRLRGATPLAVHAKIGGLPPLGSTFTLADGPLELVDESGRPSGTTVVGVAFMPTTLLATGPDALAPPAD